MTSGRRPAPPTGGRRPGEQIDGLELVALLSILDWQGLDPDARSGLQKLISWHLDDLAQEDAAPLGAGIPRQYLGM